VLRRRKLRLLADREPSEPIRAPVAERLWRDVHERLTAFVALRIDDPADVADLVQTVFLRVHRHAASVNDEDRMLPWLFQVTRNAIADYYRAPARRREVPLTVIDDSHAMPADDGDAGTSEAASGFGVAAVGRPDDEDDAIAGLAACVRPMVEQLPPLYREALTLVELEGVSQVDAAARAGISVSGMKSRVQRGRSELRQVLTACCEISRSATGGVLDFAARGGSPCATDACAPDAMPIVGLRRA
jgi:RNA polymerase sigma-70 factor (ECF subfamily)